MSERSVQEIFGEAVRQHQAGNLSGAIAGYQAVIARLPDCAEAYCNIGIAQSALGQHAQAEASLRRSIELKPAFASAQNNLGNVVMNQGRLSEAAEFFARAIRLKPDYAEAHINLSVVLLGQRRLDEAIASCRRAMALRPDIPHAYNNLGIALKDTGRVQEAIEALRRAIQISPAYIEAHCNLLLTLNYDPKASPESIFAEHVAWGDRHAAPLANQIRPNGNSRQTDRRLRIGYVSSDFRRHPVAYFIAPLLENLDRSRFEIFGYASVPGPDVMTERIRRACDGWRSILGVNDADAAEQIRKDALDILVDLGGHTSHNRLLIFARKPAPIQVAYLGYPNTTGMRAIDYRLTDDVADPPGMTDSLNSEKLWRVDGCAWCYEPHPAMPEIGRRDNGPVTFGCFNAFGKLNEPLVDLWAQVLGNVGGSRLLLKSAGAGESSSRENVHRWFESRGIAADRIEMLCQMTDSRQHFEMYNRVDVAFDAYPYHGTTTTCEALWMGVPVISLAGKTHVSRVGTSLLHHAGLEELIAQDSSEYVRIAGNWAGDADRRNEFRRTIRERTRASKVMDAKDYAHSFEQAYRQMWEQYCSAGV
jgi:predicted O-linked N-acetylglucosamine transferase (SPINDLY family)